MGDLGLSSRFSYSELLCDSFTATASNNSSYDSTSWPRFFFNQQQFNGIGLKVLEATVPFIFDTINSSNNTFVIDNASNPATTLTIPAGTYTGPQLATALQTVLNTFDVFTVSWNSDTSKFTITGDEAFNVTFTDTSPRQMLGMPLGTTYSTGNTLISPNAASPTGSLYLYINSEFFGPGIRCDSQDDERRINQICKIPINVQPGAVISFKNNYPDHFFDLRVQGNFSSFDLYITLGGDSMQRPVDMKGLGFSVTLGLLNHRGAGLPINQRPGAVNFLRG